MLFSLFFLSACDGGGEDSQPTGKDSGSTHESEPLPNEAPSTPEIEISPAAPTDDDDLTVTIVTPGVDPEGRPVSYLYTWAQDGVTVYSGIDPLIEAERTTEGETWTVTVTPTDGTDKGTPVSAAAYIGNLSPNAPGISIIPEAPVAGQTLTLVVVTAASDPEGDALTTSVQWYRDSVLDTSLADQMVVPGETVGTGQTFRAVMSVSDGVNDPVSAEISTTIANEAPVVSSVTVSPEAPGDDDVLSCAVVASDPDGDAITVVYTWYKNGSEATGVGDSNEVSNRATSTGDTWQCTVSVSDGHATTTGESATVTIGA